MTPRHAPRLLAALAALLLLLAAGCAATTPPPPAFEAPVQRQVPDVPGYQPPLAVYDPLEGLNRRIYAFNAAADRYVLLPVVDAYTMAVPAPARTAVSNFFRNIDEPVVMLNCLLQGDLRKFFMSFSRFAANTTLGLGGLIDLAGHEGLRQPDEDFGQTLGVWGVPPGPYLILPLLGPSNLRDAAGYAGSYLLADYEKEAALATLDPVARSSVRGTATALNLVDTRYQEPFRYYMTDSPFEYELLRFLYAQKRQLDVEK
ncbi:MAG: VacJ family lipoprotein [Desulfovibrionaceae bacterium]